MFRIVVFLLVLITAVPVRAQPPLPRCGERPTFVDPPWVNGKKWCLEEVFQDPARAELAFTSLAAAPDGTLYAASPMTGRVLAFADTDGDGLPETPRTAIEGVTSPNGLVYYDGALYISGGTRLYRWQDEDLTILVDDLPTGGFWVGGLTVGPDERLYVGVLTSCDLCQPREGQGAVWSFALDGSDGQMIADGFRAPADTAFLHDTLWVVDAAPPSFENTPDADELNRVAPGMFFGWPNCVGTAANPAWNKGEFDCSPAASPALTLPTHSAPLGLTAYTSSTFPNIQNTLLVALSGSYNRAALTGYSLAAVWFDEDGHPTDYTIILPEQADIYNPPGLTLQDVQYRGSGLWPQRPLDVTVSAEGWIYLSVSGGRILALRPNQ